MKDAFEDPWALFDKRIRTAPERVAIRTGDRELSFAQLGRAVAALATRSAASLGPQDAVGVLLGMLPEYLVADLTILRSNLVKVPLNPMLSGAEMAYILEHSEAKALYTSSALPATEAEKVAEIARALPQLQIIDVDFDALLADADEVVARVAASPDDRAAIYYTGGTTGKPKGVIHTRYGVAATIVSHALEAEIGSGDVLLLSTSLSHSAGSFAHASIARGATLVLLDKFTPADFCRVAREQGANWAMVVPTMLYRLLDHLAEHPEDLPPLDTLVYGSAPITPSRLREAIERFGPIFIQLFGQTEVPNWGTSLGKRDHAEALVKPELLLSCGAPCTFADVRVVDDAGDESPAGESGEILLTAPYAMAGY